MTAARSLAIAAALAALAGCCNADVPAWEVKKLRAADGTEYVVSRHLGGCTFRVVEVPK